jgi:hypothetical protein
MAPRDFADVSPPAPEDAVEARKAAFTRFLGIQPRWSLLTEMVWTEPLFRGFLFVMLAACVLQVSLGPKAQQHNGPFPFALVIFAPFALGYFMWFRMRRRARAAFNDRACPDCGFPLNGIPNTRSTIQPSLDLGPARCPECGSPWPLIPPAILKPREITALRQSP